MKSKTIQALLPSPLKASPRLPWGQPLPSWLKQPGVYWFLDSKNKVLYIGKAKNLRSRLQSYRLKANLIGKTKQLLKQVKSFSACPVLNELQATILEAQLIKTIQPKYNIRLKDDRSPLYIAITNEYIPRVLTIRKSNIQNNRLLATPGRKIKYYFGPFPSGFQTRQVLKSVRKIFPFCSATPHQQKHGKACFYSHLGLCLGICQGKVSRRAYLAMINQLARFLAGDESKVIRTLKKSMYAAARNQQYEKAASLRNQLELISKLQTKRLRINEASPMQKQFKAQLQTQTLAQVLKLPTRPRRIEAYDVSNIQGTYATGSMVVFINGQPQTNQYRQFKIRSLSSANDTGMLQEILSRRANHPDWPKPDLIVIDGGKSQVNVGLKVLKKNPNLKQIPIIGLAKREETIIYQNRQMKLKATNPALKLIQALRDEAHRFARAYYRKLHQKSLLKDKSP